MLVNSGANVLILDEPTNHLDIESREALEDALRAFTGAVLLVSHDRALLDAVGTRTVAVEERSLRSYTGGWPEYVRVRDELRAESGKPAAHAGQGNDRSKIGQHMTRSGNAHTRVNKLRPQPHAAGADGSHATRPGNAHARSHGTAHAPSRHPAHAPDGTAPKPGEHKAKGKPKPKRTGPSKNRLTAQAAAELAVEQAEATLRAVEDQLADPAAWATQYESAKSEARHTAARRAVEAAYARLEALVE